MSYQINRTPRDIMFIKRFLFISAVLASSMFLAACGDDSAKNYGDILHDKAAMAKLEATVKEFGKGKEVRVFQGISMTTGSATVNMQVPDEPAKVVQQSWHSDLGWKTVPVTIIGDENFEDNLTPLSAFNLPAVVDFVTACEKLVHDKGHKTFVIESLHIEWSWKDGSLSFAAQAPMDSQSQKTAHFNGTSEGKVTKAFVQEWDDKAKPTVRVSLLE